MSASPNTATTANTPRASVLDTCGSALRQAWAQRQPREQRLLAAGAGVLVLAALWQGALAPALHTWQEAPAQQARLDQQSQTMQQLQAQAKNLQQAHTINRSDSAQWLEMNLAALGTGAKISVQGERATLSLEATSPEALARWLSLARERALAIPVQAQLQRSNRGGPASNASKDRPTMATGPTGTTAASASLSSVASPAPSAADPAVLWRGSLVLRLP